MYKKSAQGWLKHFDFILLDMICLHAAFVLAYIIRHGLINPYQNVNYLNLSIVLTFIDVTVLFYNSSLKNVLKRGYYNEFTKTVSHSLLVLVLVSFYLFSTQSGQTFSRIVIYLFVIFYILLSYFTRILWKRFLLSGKVALDKPSVVIITNDARACDVVNQFITGSNGRHMLTGVCVYDQDIIGGYVAGINVVANSENVLEYLCRNWVDEVYVSLPNNKQTKKLIDKLAIMGMIVHVEMEYYSNPDWPTQVIEEVADSTVLTIGMNIVTPKQIFMKRTMDICIAVVGCLITIVLTIIVGPLIFINSPGPIFFAQTRVGRNGKTFKMYKFRSMYLDAEERKAELMKENRVKDGLMFKLEYDPRIIGCKKRADGTIKKGIGNFIRDWSIDEFPQFFNVLLGHMSVVGVRAPIVSEYEKYSLHHRARLAFKPGITGLWQVSGRSNITDFEDVVELDTKYIKNWGIGQDFKILFKTVKVVLFREGAM